MAKVVGRHSEHFNIEVEYDWTVSEGSAPVTNVFTPTGRVRIDGGDWIALKDNLERLLRGFTRN